MKKVTVYCASSSNVRDIFLNAAFDLGEKLAQNGCEIFYGGGKVGLMGKLADGVLSAGGKVRGIIPEFMMNIELGNHKATELRIVPDMHIRQRIMMEESDILIALPGGSGTFLEFFEAVSWKRLGLIMPEIILVNIDEYYKPMIEMLKKSISEKFMHKDYERIWKITSSVDETIELVNMINNNSQIKLNYE